MVGGRRGGRAGLWLPVSVVAALVVLGVVGAPAPPPAAAATVPIDLARPRIVLRGADVPVVQERVEREPYRTLMLRTATPIRQAEGIALDDHLIASERIKAKAAKDLAFQYAIDRTVVNGEVVPFPTPAARQAAGDRVKELLLAMYTESRLGGPPPLGGSDRDINTSEEIVGYASAYDTLAGAGYDFGADHDAVRENIADLAADLYDNYVHIETAGNLAATLPNNHRSKSAAAIGVAALALAESQPDLDADPDDIRDPGAWLAFAIDQIDLVEQWLYGAGDGAYGEGTYYQRYAAQNLLPFLRAWDRLTGGAAVVVGGRTLPSLYRDPASRATQRWLLDMTLPDGSLAPIDDGNVGFSYYWGALPQDGPDAPAYAWRWANAPVPYDSDGSIDLAADQIVAFDDSITPAPPSGSPTRFYLDGGNAVFRSDWGPDAVTSVVLGEHGAAMELGRDREGKGRLASAAHEHPDAGAFLLHAFGERLLLDPGYLTWETRAAVNKAEDHNGILVNGAGPKDPFTASVFWAQDFSGPPPVDGEATLSAPFDTGFVDGARVTTRYGSPATDVSRRFLFADDRYLLVEDRVAAAAPADFTWLLHGNGGGTSGGTFTPQPLGGRWERAGARIDAVVVGSGTPLTIGTRTANHEVEGRRQLTHTALSATGSGATARALTLLYPTRAGDPAPLIGRIPGPGTGLVLLADPVADRVIAAAEDPSGAGTIGSTRLADLRANGTLRLAYTRDARQLRDFTQGYVFTPTPGELGIRLSPDRAEVLARNADTWIIVTPGFDAASVDGACQAVPTPIGTFVRPGADRAFTLKTEPGNGAPAADPGAERTVTPGTTVTLDGAASCDPDGDALTPHWELVSAPAGSARSLTGADTWTPQLVADAPGPFRLRLTVTDAHGATSRPVDTTVWSGPRCAGDRLRWSDPAC